MADKNGMFENKGKTNPKILLIISIDDDLDHESIQMGLPISELRGYLFTKDGWRYQLLYGKFESTVPFREGVGSVTDQRNGYGYQRPDHIFSKMKDNNTIICSRKLEKLMSFEE